MRDTLKRYLEDRMREFGEEVVLEPDDDLLAAGIDSIGFMRLIAYVEETFALHIPPEDVTLETFGTIASIAGYLESRKGVTG